MHRHDFMPLQEAGSSTPTPRRSRVSSIFQQKTVKQDDIDADFLKHVAFAAQRSSPSPSASETHLTDQHAGQPPITKGTQPVLLPAAAQLAAKGTSPPAEVQPGVAGEFTLATIEQSIAEIEAELGWTSASAATLVAASSSDVVKSSAVPPGILASVHTDRQHAAFLSSAGKASCCFS